jgi:hypothetical protein
VTASWTRVSRPARCFASLGLKLQGPVRVRGVERLLDEGGRVDRREILAPADLVRAGRVVDPAAGDRAVDLHRERVAGGALAGATALLTLLTGHLDAGVGVREPGCRP